MANKLYPPQIEGSLPAFYLNYDSSNSIVLNANITIPFSMNAAVSSNQIKAFVLRLRTTSSGSYLFAPVYSENFNLGENTVTFGLSQSQAASLNEGQFYKVQIAYCASAYEDAAGKIIGDDVGYFSTVGIIKCTSKPTIYINNLIATNVNFFSNDYIGVYDQSSCKDQTEKVYSYEFIVYDENEEIYYTTGEKLHQSSYDTDYTFSIDKVSINDFVVSGVIYSIQYKVTTMNNLILTTPKYKITNENLVAPNKNIKIIPEANEDNGYITIKFKGDLDLSKSWYYVLNESLLSKEQDDNGNYIKDFLGNTVKTVAHQIEQYNEKLAYLKSHTLFRYHETLYNFFYKWDKNKPDNTTKKIINDEIRYIDSELLSITSENEIENLPYYTPIATGRDLIKNISYKYAIDNYLEVNESSHYLKFSPSKELEDSLLIAQKTCSDLSFNLSNYSGDEAGKNILRQQLREARANLAAIEQEIENTTKFYLIATQPYEAFYYGSYILSRASDQDNYSTWFIINRFKFDEQAPSSYSVKDITVEHGRRYKYSLQQTNIWGLVSSRILSDVAYANFEDMYLYDGNKVLKIRYNPKVDSFKTNLLEQKTDTIGGRFPYITRNGATWYKQFPIGGLIAQELDNDECFVNRNYGLAHRHSTSVNKDTDIPENALRDFHMFSTENILLEREFKNAVLDWLNDGNPKLFKSPYEGNYIVRLMQNTLTPVNELGRMLHSFTSQAYEIAECNYENLLAYGFIKALPPSDYTGLWKTYLLTDPELKDENGDIVIKFDVGLNTFTVQDMMPGDIIYILFSDNADWEEIMIGITGSYTYANSDRIINKIKIHQQSEIPQTSNRNTVGILNCYYQGVRISAFDSILEQKLITIPSKQFIGVNPWLDTVKRMNWWTQTNEGDFSFPLTEAQYEQLQNYNIRDYLDGDTLVQGNGGSQIIYKVTDNSIENLATFEPGELIDQINLTLNHGETYKIQLLNIEQAKFRLRDIIPVYIIEENGKPGEFNSNKKMYGEKDKIDGNENTTDNQYVSVSPYGYPHRIEELTKFEMIDPYCIFEVFEMTDSGNWRPITNLSSPYYDPYYRTWLNRYDPTVKINYHWKKAAIITPECTLPEKKALAITNKNAGIPYNDEDIYNYTIEYDNNYNYFYYINDYNEKIILEGTTHFDLYYKKGNNYYAYGTLSGVISKNIPKIYYVKEYDNNISLMTIKEKEYQNLTDVNSILIGSGVIAELTFQIKVIDYYTEIQDDDVRAAKDNYLQKRNLQMDLPKTQAIIQSADYYRIKYSALYNAYGKLLNGTNKTFLTSGDKQVIKSLLGNNYEVSQLNLLTLYNLTSINEELDLTLLQQLHQYKEDHIDEENFGFDNIEVYYINENNIITYFVLDKRNILMTSGTENSENNTLFYQRNISNNDEIFYMVNLNYIYDLYPDLLIIKDDLRIVYNNEYNLENINDYVLTTNTMADSNLNILELSLYEDEQIIQEKWTLLNKESIELIKNNTNFIALEEIIYQNDDLTPNTFFEQKELEDLAKDKNIEIEGVEKKLLDLNEEIDSLNEEINNLNDVIISEQSEYIQLYNNLHDALNSYNIKVYTNWAYNELIRLSGTPGQSPEDILTYYNSQGNVLAEELDKVQSKISNILYACDNLYNQILDNTPKINRYNQMIVDATTSEKLKEYLNNQIIEKYGNSVLCLLALYHGINELNNLINTDQQWNMFGNNFKNIITNYKKAYNLFVIQSTHRINEFYYDGLEKYLININENFNKLYEYETNLIRAGDEYTNPEAYAELCNYYDDTSLIYSLLQEEEKIILIQDNEENEYSINNILPNDDIKFNTFISKNPPIYNTYKKNPLEDQILSIQQLYYNETQYNQLITLKEQGTYFYRKDINLNITQEIDTTYYTTFIFYPLVENRKDNNISEQYKSNKDYYDHLTDEEKEAVLEISAQLSNIITTFLTEQYRKTYGAGENFINYLNNNYLGNGQLYNKETLDKEKNQIINDTAYNNFRNKIYSVEQQLEYPLKGLDFYTDENGKLISRKWFLIPSSLPQSITYIKTSMYTLSDVTIDTYTGDTIIQPGYFLEYINWLAQDELETKKIILKQALKLLNLYEEQHDNYTTKYNEYRKVFNDYTTIYNSYLGTDEMDFYRNTNKSIDKYRHDVKVAWWNFLNILDYKYTKEKERGMYI